MYVYRYILYINFKFGARTINFIFVGIGNLRSEYLVSIQTGTTYTIRSIKLCYKEVLRENCSTRPLETTGRSRTSTTGPSVPSNEESRYNQCYKLAGFELSISHGLCQGCTARSCLEGKCRIYKETIPCIVKKERQYILLSYQCSCCTFNVASRFQRRNSTGSCERV
ncbi:unnamed protein product [Callosobruchus maculatus]|uniref:Uncharacterized protein n=1 Tax=Callosobruchus maculatus TaxID=64391 RepID=A0A653DIC2_CALMS|nr:unnamed protein product [Callosobruchus maculatus]